MYFFCSFRISQFGSQFTGETKGNLLIFSCLFYCTTQNLVLNHMEVLVKLKKKSLKIKFQIRKMLKVPPFLPFCHFWGGRTHALARARA